MSPFVWQTPRCASDVTSGGDGWNLRRSLQEGQMYPSGVGGVQARVQRPDPQHGGQMLDQSRVSG